MLDVNDRTDNNGRYIYIYYIYIYAFLQSESRIQNDRQKNNDDITEITGIGTDMGKELAASATVTSGS
jgi:hypothetical protein